MPFNKAGLGLLNPVISAQEEYLSSTRGSAELLQAVTRGGAFSNDNHLWNLSEERCDRKKDRDITYKSRLKGLVSDLKGTDKRLLLRAKIKGSWLSVRSTTVSGTVISSMEFQDY